MEWGEWRLGPVAPVIAQWGWRTGPLAARGSGFVARGSWLVTRGSRLVARGLQLVACSLWLVCDVPGTSGEQKPIVWRELWSALCDVPGTSREQKPLV